MVPCFIQEFVYNRLACHSEYPLKEMFDDVQNIIQVTFPYRSLSLCNRGFPKLFPWSVKTRETTFLRPFVPNFSRVPDHQRLKKTPTLSVSIYQPISKIPPPELTKTFWSVIPPKDYGTRSATKSQKYSSVALRKISTTKKSKDISRGYSFSC